MNIKQLENQYLVLTKSSITIKDLQMLTGLSYEKARQNFNNLKKLYKQYIKKNSSVEVYLLNSRQLPLNSYILEILRDCYGIDKQSMIDNIRYLKEINLNKKNNSIKF